MPAHGFMANRLSQITFPYVVSSVVVMTLLLGACATSSVSGVHLPPLNNQPTITVPDLAVREISPEMKAFLDRYVSDAANPDARVWSLVWAANDRSILPFKYDADLTLTSTEAFSRKTGNCLAFANMLVAMARSQDLGAWYQEVEIPPTWADSNSTLLVSMHINVALRGRHDRWVVDISGENVSAPYKIRRIDDDEALAHHYNNLGASALVKGDLATAWAYYRKAIETAPELSFLWSNIGVVYSRNDQTATAIQAYQEALNLDPGQAPAANNLYLIYREQGNQAAADKIQSKVERHRRKNPYYLYFLASQAAVQGNHETSVAMLKKAISINGNEYRFYYQLARLQALDGDLEAAQANLDRALNLAPDGSPISGASIDRLPELAE